MEQKTVDILVAIIKEGKLVQVTNAVRYVAQEFEKVDFAWLGLGPELDAGIIEDRMYWRMWSDVKEVLGWEVDWDYRYSVFKVFLEHGIEPVRRPSKGVTEDE